MKKLSVFLALISLAIVFIFSCQKDKTYEAGESNNLKTTVTGIVLDESNAPLNGVTVTAYGQTTSTNQYGTFVLKNMNVNKDRCVLQFTKAGFFKRMHGFIASGNTVNYVHIVLLSNTPTQSFAAAVGGTVSLPDGSSAEFQPNSFVTSNGSAYAGTVNLIVKHLSPDDANFGFMIPGGDLLGKDLNNKDVALYTYGMLGVELTGSSGEALQLAEGTSATLTMAIAASQLSSAPASIPLWYFDEATSLWKEEGAANKVGNNYVGTVKHFSWWNCDFYGSRAYIKGRVIDCNGIPIENATVWNTTWGHGTTDQNGMYEGGILSGMPSNINATYNNSTISLVSQYENIPALSTNQIFDVPDLVIACPTRVAGTIKTCSDQNTDGFVFIADGNFNNFQYTTNGEFNLISIENASLNLTAVNPSFNNSYSQFINTLFPPATLNVGNILLCDTVSGSANNVVINGGPFSNQLFNIIPTVATAEINQNLSVNVSGTAFPNYTVTYNIQMNSVPGTYQWNNSSLMLFLNDSLNQQYSITNLDTSASSGIINLTEVNNIGGRVKGNFAGTVLMNGPGQQWNVILSGSFDVIRTQ